MAKRGQTSKVDFSPLDLSDFGLAFPLAVPQWVAHCRPHLPAIRMALRALQVTKAEMSGMADPGEGKPVGEEIADQLQGAIKWLHWLADVVKAAEVRVLAATRHFIDEKGKQA